MLHYLVDAAYIGISVTYKPIYYTGSISVTLILFIGIYVTLNDYALSRIGTHQYPKPHLGGAQWDA
jgi:hypothetical protein